MSALRNKLHAIVDELASVLEQGAGDDWIDQNHSPLGKQKHLSLAKSGKLPASKEGKQVLIRRSAIDAYLAKHAIVLVDSEADEARAVDRLIASAGRRSA